MFHVKQSVNICTENRAYNRHSRGVFKKTLRRRESEKRREQQSCSHIDPVCVNVLNRHTNGMTIYVIFLARMTII